MSENKYIGFCSTISSDVIQNEEGTWTCKVTYREDRSKDLLDWERKETSLKVTDDTKEEALAKANSQLMLILEAYDGTLFHEKVEE